MRLDLIRDKSAFLRKIAALGSIGAFLVTIALSDAPRLHEHLHKALGPDHECAATIFASGKCEHSACDSPSAVPPSASPAIAFLPRELQSVALALEFSRLEHAPPPVS